MEIGTTTSKAAILRKEYAEKLASDNINKPELCSISTKEDSVCWTCGTQAVAATDEKLAVYKRPLPKNYSPNPAAESLTSADLPVPTAVDSVNIKIANNETKLENYINTNPIVKRILKVYNKWSSQHIDSQKPNLESFEKFLSSHPKAEKYASAHTEFFKRFFSNPTYIKLLNKL